MEIHTIGVAYDAATESLSVAEPEVTLHQPQASFDPVPVVIWRFDGIDALVAEGCWPTIDFKPPGSGPFSNLCRWPAGIAGCGNGGVTGRFPYRVVLRGRGREVIARSSRAQLINNVALEQPDTSPVITVTMTPGSPVLTVEPEAVLRVEGQAVTWRLVGDPTSLLGEFVPRVVFYGDPNDPSVTAPEYGPFGSWEYHGTSLLGTGRSGQGGVHHYRFELISLTEEGLMIQSSPDPTVDDRGEPPFGNLYRPGLRV